MMTWSWTCTPGVVTRLKYGREVSSLTPRAGPMPKVACCFGWLFAAYATAGGVWLGGETADATAGWRTTAVMAAAAASTRRCRARETSCAVPDKVDIACSPRVCRRSLIGRGGLEAHPARCCQAAVVRSGDRERHGRVVKTCRRAGWCVEVH